MSAEALTVNFKVDEDEDFCYEDIHLGETQIAYKKIIFGVICTLTLVLTHEKFD
jgi:hypothetical protein